MYRPKTIMLKKKLNRANLERELRDKGWNEYDLASYYITGFKGFNISVKSDLRSDDKNESLVARIQDGKLIISDFGLKVGMNIYNYLIEKYYPNSRDGFIQVLEMIRRDFNLNRLEPLQKYRVSNKTIKPKKANKIVKDTSLPVKIEVRRQRHFREKKKVYWRKEDIEYWAQYGITVKKLEEKGIAPLEKFWITNYNKDGIRREYNVEKELCYVYPFFKSKDGFFMYKIYLPEGLKNNKDFRWISNVNKKVVQNAQVLPKNGDLLIIQSSYKDSILMEILKEDIHVIAPNGEGIWFDPKVWDYLKTNWKRIVYFANNDFEKINNPGLKMARSHAEKYKVPFVCTPDNSASDISDFYKKYGRKKTLELLNDRLEKIDLIT